MYLITLSEDYAWTGCWSWPIWSRWPEPCCLFFPSPRTWAINNHQPIFTTTLSTCCCWFFLGSLTMAGTYGMILVTFPTALVRPSRKTNLWPSFRNSGCLTNLWEIILLEIFLWQSGYNYLNNTWALSPVLRHSEDILMMEAVCLMEPQWTMAWYLQDMVVGWCSTRISPSNS